MEALHFLGLLKSAALELKKASNGAMKVHPSLRKINPNYLP